MGRLVAMGGIHVPGQRIRSLEKSLERLCKSKNFPDGEAFKWSPDRSYWMRKNLIETARTDFFRAALELAKNHDVRVVAVVEDLSRNTATGLSDHELDATKLLLERFDSTLSAEDRDGIVVVAKPSGGSAQETQLQETCVEMLQSGTGFVQPNRIAISVMTSPFKQVRCLQLADLTVSLSLAMVSGNTTYAQDLFPLIKAMLYISGGRRGGFGLKLHPDYTYRNLYHWLLGDTVIPEGPNARHFLLQKGHAYFRSPWDVASHPGEDD